MFKDDSVLFSHEKSVCNNYSVNVLLCISAINQEKQEVELRESIGKHNRNSLKKVETHEKDALKES